MRQIRKCSANEEVLNKKCKRCTESIALWLFVTLSRSRGFVLSMVVPTETDQKLLKHLKSLGDSSGSLLWPYFVPASIVPFVIQTKLLGAYHRGAKTRWWPSTFNAHESYIWEVLAEIDLQLRLFTTVFRNKIFLSFGPTRSMMQWLCTLSYYMTFRRGHIVSLVERTWDQVW